MLYQMACPKFIKHIFNEKETRIKLSEITSYQPHDAQDSWAISFKLKRESRIHWYFENAAERDKNLAEIDRVLGMPDKSDEEKFREILMRETTGLGSSALVETQPAQKNLFQSGELIAAFNGKRIDDIYWYLSRSLLMRLFGRQFYNDERDQFFLDEIDKILYEVSKTWHLEPPITRVEFGFRKDSIPPVLRVNIDKIYYPAAMALVEFYKKPENHRDRLGDIEIIFEVKNV